MKSSKIKADLKNMIFKKFFVNKLVLVISTIPEIVHEVVTVSEK